MRVRVAGLIDKDSSIVMVRHLKNSKSYWLLPGGGIKIGETMKTALIREMKEELNIDARIGDLLFVAETLYSEIEHIIQPVFYTEVKNLDKIHLGIDMRVVDYDFFDINKLNNILIYPDIKNELKSYLNTKLIKRRYVYKRWLD